MPRATEILSQIFDKDGIKYKKTDNRIKIDSKDCTISIEGNGSGYNINAKCLTETDRDINSIFINLKDIYKFEITRIAPEQLLVRGIESPHGNEIGSVSINTSTERKIPHNQTSNILCLNEICKLTKGDGWED